MLDFVRDIYASFRQTSLERVKSPFLGAFVFSWVGFNWQMLSILFFSKKEIEQRIELINHSYDIGNYLLGPICTTILIVILLPRLNKFITKIQDKPNSETVELSLSSKIKIAELQQSIAEIEAKKKLADKKEERNIEEGIDNIKMKLKETTDRLISRNEELETLLAKNNDLQGWLAKSESKFNVEQEAKSQLQDELNREKENNYTMGKKILELTALASKFETDFNGANELQKNAYRANKELKDNLENLHIMMLSYVKRFPEIFEVKDSKGYDYLSLKGDARPLLDSINISLKSRNSDSGNNGSFTL